MKSNTKHIVITGGASGLGLELVRQLYKDNDISVIARPSRGLEKLRNDFKKLNIYEADLANLREVEKAAGALAKSEPTIDILINNAAVQYTPKFLDDDFVYESIQQEVTVNFTAICTLIYLLLPSLLGDEQSIIMNINSGLGLVPKKSSAVYCATKGALNIFSQSLSHQLEESNVEVKQAFLPLVDTAMTKGRGQQKLAPDFVATAIIQGLSSRRREIDIGKVKALRPLLRFAPRLAKKIMKAA